MIDIPCVIFAGGKSSRMGEDKALLPFEKHNTLTEYQLNQHSKTFQNIYISCKSKEKFDFNANFIEDLNQELFAPTTAFISIFHRLDNDSFFAISVDTPFIDNTIIKTLVEEDNGSFDAVVAVVDEQIQPLCGIYHRTLLSAFTDMEEQNIHKLNYLLKNSNVKFVPFEDKNKFLNLNNKEEYQKALEIINASLI
ncbi:molybdenum cofactor guanylyltransferase MobA [Sulfurimonas sp. C5]|uniref:molybdenum cofactor guanylyltransferase MobA n=1 Tax=Sulfurimonas sp. C5 TaxID=3036947 RepID=UPI002458B5EE|nr:molybdenum cofactor guanylyltransferase MobA [Sulfurimonas sp. C5]MDH4944275.1 molybdenum cofactor guanylyltransferase MobA [Sulfurimonas sp. C5]